MTTKKVEARPDIDGRKELTQTLTHQPPDRSADGASASEVLALRFIEAALESLTAPAFVETLAGIIEDERWDEIDPAQLGRTVITLSKRAHSKQRDGLGSYRHARAGLERLFRAATRPGKGTTKVSRKVNEFREALSFLKKFEEGKMVLAAATAAFNYGGETHSPPNPADQAVSRILKRQSSRDADIEGVDVLAEMLRPLRGLDGKPLFPNPGAARRSASGMWKRNAKVLDLVEDYAERGLSPVVHRNLRRALGLTRRTRRLVK